MAVTSWTVATRSGTRRRPMAPAAPATKTFIVVLHGSGMGRRRGVCSSWADPPAGPAARESPCRARPRTRLLEPHAVEVLDDLRGARARTLLLVERGDVRREGAGAVAPDGAGPAPVSAADCRRFLAPVDVGVDRRVDEGDLHDRRRPSAAGSRRPCPWSFHPLDRRTAPGASHRWSRRSPHG